MAGSINPDVHGSIFVKTDWIGKKRCSSENEASARSIGCHQHQSCILKMYPHRATQQLHNSPCTMTEKESQYAVVRWLQELCQADSIPTAKKSEIKEAIAKLSDLFGVDITSYDDAINMDYTTLQIQEIMTAAKDALKAGHFDEDEIHANEDRRYGPFYDVIKSKQVIYWTFFIFVDFLMIFILSSSHSLYEITHTV